MLTMYSGRGAQDYSVEDPCVTPDTWATLRQSTSDRLRKQGSDDDADLFDGLPFELRQGKNFFGDEFVVLYAEVPLNRYIELVDMHSDDGERAAFHRIAATLAEICPKLVRFVAFDTTLDGDVDRVQEPKLRINNNTVVEAMNDARHLIKVRGSTSGIDRVHTAFHGYLRVLCEDAEIEIADDAGITVLYRALRDHHPRLQAEGARSEDITKMLRMVASIIHVLNPLRNRASMAHPSADLLEEAEADFVLNCIHTLLHYLDRKLV